MSKPKGKRSAWGLLHRGGRLLGKYAISHDEPPHHLGAYTTCAFGTRQEARDAIKDHKALERMRTDGWRHWLDVHPVRITISVTEASDEH